MLYAVALSSDQMILLSAFNLKSFQAIAIVKSIISQLFLATFMKDTKDGKFRRSQHTWS